MHKKYTHRLISFSFSFLTHIKAINSLIQSKIFIHYFQINYSKEYKGDKLKSHTVCKGKNIEQKSRQ